MKIKTDKIESRAIFVVYFSSFLANCLPPVRLNLTSQRLVLTKILNKRPFLEVEGVGANPRGTLI